MTSRLRETADKPDADIELSEIGLLDQQQGAGSSQSWYSASGRGFTVNGRHQESQGGTSHIGTVLGEGFYSRERRNQKIWEFITEKPLKAFNMPSVALAVIVFILALVLAGHSSHSREMSTGNEAHYAPEGSVNIDVAQSYDYRGRPRRVVSPFQSVAADHGRCSDLGLQILEEGGNAVDGVVATALCQGVMNPGASGIGGGAFIVIRLPNGTSEVVDAREVAPAAATEDMFRGNESASLDGGLAVGVPLELKGLWAAHRRYGNVSWHILVEPAAALARKGFPAHPYLVDKITDQLERFQQDAQLREAFLIEDGGKWRPPKALAADIQAAGGVITVDDLRNAEPLLKPSISAKVFGIDIIGPPPPSSAAVVIAALHILQGYAQQLPFAGPVSSHWLVEAMKSAFALRSHLGDPGACSEDADCFLDLDAVLNDTLSPDFADSLRDSFNDAAVQEAGQYGGVWSVNVSLGEDHGTSHISVVDRNRMAVAMTTSINTSFGSKVLSKSTGILLNNEMDDFSTPGQSNAYGLEPSPANFIRPGKKPLSSMSPMILSDRSGLRLVVGAGGGSRIITAVLTSIFRMVALGQEPLSAISMPRLHHQLFPESVAAESWATASSNFTVADEVIAALEKRGNTVAGTTWGAVCQAIAVNPDTGFLTSVSDPRKDGAPAGS